MPCFILLIYMKIYINNTNEKNANRNICQVFKSEKINNKKQNKNFKTLSRQKIMTYVRELRQDI